MKNKQNNTIKINNARLTKVNEKDVEAQIKREKDLEKKLDQLNKASERVRQHYNYIKTHKKHPSPLKLDDTFEEWKIRIDQFQEREKIREQKVANIQKQREKDMLYQKQVNKIRKEQCQKNRQLLKKEMKQKLTKIKNKHILEDVYYFEYHRGLDKNNSKLTSIDSDNHRKLLSRIKIGQLSNNSNKLLSTWDKVDVKSMKSVPATVQKEQRKAIRQGTRQGARPKKMKSSMTNSPLATGIKDNNGTSPKSASKVNIDIKSSEEKSTKKGYKFELDSENSDPEPQKPITEDQASSKDISPIKIISQNNQDDTKIEKTLTPKIESKEEIYSEVNQNSPPTKKSKNEEDDEYGDDFEIDSHHNDSSYENILESMDYS